MSQLAIGPMAGATTMTRRPFGAAPISGVVSRPAGSAASRLARVRWSRLVTLLLLVALAIAGTAAALGQANARPVVDRGDGAVVVGRDTALREHVVAPGDTLWRLAEATAPGSDPRELVDRIMRLNGLSGVDVQVGTILLLPAQP